MKNFGTFNTRIINSIYAFDINIEALIISKYIISAELKLSAKLTKNFLDQAKQFL